MGHGLPPFHLRVGLATFVSRACPEERLAQCPSTPANQGTGDTGEAKPYSRGSSSRALQALSDPAACRRHLWEGVSSSTSRGPTKSRQQLWEQLSTKAGFVDPFCLTPDHIYVVMGALKTAEYRSADQYLEAARALHIAAGHPWTDQLAQARRAAIRSCKRHLGHPKQAGGLPLSQLGDLPVLQQPVSPGGPVWPVRSTLLASWWLLREIEASKASRHHVEVDTSALKVTWRLPSSKTDQAALGAYRAHRCSCAFTAVNICPYHLMVAHLEALPPSQTVLFPCDHGTPATKAGWADTFQAIAQQLGLPILHPNGARKYTGHSARVTGARHLASSQTELWRVQLFGRWGSDVFVHYIQDAPLEQLDSLALESGVKLSIEQARRELQDLIRQIPDRPHSIIASSPQEMLEDCAVPMEIDPCPSSVPPADHGVVNNSPGGKLHLPYDQTGHPRSWKTRCGWRFGLAHAEFSWVPEPQFSTYRSSSRCSKCFPPSQYPPHSSESSSSSSSSSA